MTNAIETLLAEIGYWCEQIDKWEQERSEPVSREIVDSLAAAEKNLRDHLSAELSQGRPDEV